MLLTNGHDGTRAYSGSKIIERLVCTNGLTRGDARKLFSLRHTRTINDRREWVTGLVETIRRESEVAVDTFRILAARSMTSAEIEGYLRAVFPDPTETEAVRAKAHAERTRAAILGLVEGGRGAEIPGVRGTAWGTYNAVTEWADHHRNAGQPAERRLESNLYGAGAEFKSTALSAILAIL